MPPVTDADPNPLIALFRQCVVCITDEAGEFHGSGFFVAPGWVLTCGHVVHGVPGLQVKWQDRVAPVTVAGAMPPLESVTDPGSYPLPDLAVLDVPGAAEWMHPCAGLAVEQPVLAGSSDDLYLAGYTIEHGLMPALTGATTEFESLITEDGHAFFKLKHGLVLPGFSGSPLLDRSGGFVAGIVESTRSRQADLGGFAMPVSELAAAFPQVFEANQMFHRDDHQWRDAVEAEKVHEAERKGSRARLPLRAPIVPLVRDADVSAAKILRPRHAIVDYVGREQLLGALADWCEYEPPDGAPVGLWFVTGGGGFGKTRLAVEACREAEARGWTAGLLAPGASEARVQALAEWPGRLLIAVDYAEADPGLVGRLVEELAAREPRPSVRVMLLVRRRSSRADLLHLFNEQQEDGLDALLRRAQISRLEEAGSEIDRLELFQQAVHDFAGFLGVPPPELRPPRLRADHFARPLYVLAAAYLARASESMDVDALTEADLLRTLLTEHEASHWDRWNQRRELGLDRADQRTAVAVATLLTAQGEGEALTLTRLIPHFGREAEPQLIAVARWLAQLYPPPEANQQLVIAPLEPDRVGEVLVGDVLREHPGLLAAAIDAASDRQLARALTVAGRIARDDQAVNEQLRAILDERLGDLLQRGLNADGDELLNAVITAMTTSRPVRGAIDTAERLPNALPVWMRPLAAAVTTLAVDGLRARASDDPSAVSDLAGWLNNLANRLSETGERQQALDAAQEAVTHYRQLAQDNPATYLPDLAMSLNTLANRLSGTGERQQAREVAQEVITHYRQLAQDNPGAYLADLAMSLNNLANRLSETGERQQALDAAQEAVTHYRQLAQDNPATYLPDLASSLNNLAKILSDVGEQQQAQEVAQEAVTIRRQLAQASPATYLPDLAMTLTNLARSFGYLGEWQQALDTAQEAVTHYRQLAQASAAAYLPYLATSLNNLASHLSDVGEWQQALEVAQEAVTIRRQLAQDNPAAYLPDLATSLNNLASHLSETGERQQALEVAQEAVTIRRQLAQDNPAAHFSSLASSLNNLANRLSDVGEQQQALEVAQEAVTHYRQLAQASPAVHLPDLAMSLNNLANRLSDVGEQQQALEVAQEAVTHYRQLAQASPAAYLPNLATSLNNLASYLSEAGKSDEAEELFAGVLGGFPDSASGVGHLLVARARWRVGQKRLADAIADLIAALKAFERDSDWLARGQARQRLRGLREGERSGFDRAWDQGGHPLPVWLRYPASDEQFTGKTVAWVKTPDWAASKAYLTDNAASLLTGKAEAALEHLIDANPAAATLDEHLRLLKAARAVGVDDAYAAHQQQRLTARRAQILQEWVNTPTWAASRAFAADHRGDLLHSATRAILDDLAGQDLADPVLRLHRGLLGYAAIAGLDAAYDLRAETIRQRQMVTDPATPADTRLAVARLHSGQARDDPEAHFQLTISTLLAGSPDDAETALADCASNAAPYERRDFARRLHQASAGQPQLAAITAELEQILIAPDSQANGERGDAGGVPAEDTLFGLLVAWVGTPTWEESEAFLTSHTQELLTLRGYAALRQLAATRSGDDSVTLHLNLLRAVLAQGITAAYTQLHSKFAEERRARVLREWIGLAADPAASAAYLTGHGRDLNDPQTIELLAAECDRNPGDPRLWRHLGLLLLTDQAADGYAAVQTGDPNPLERSAALLDSGDLDRALGWACVARATDPGPGSLLMGQVQARRGDLGRAREALATATEQINPGRLGEVLAAYDRLIAAQPDEAWLHAEHGDALQRADRHDEALAAYDQALSLAPGDPSLHFNKGHLLFSQSRMDQAQAEFLTVEQLRPGDILSPAVLLAAIAWPTDTDQARQHLQAALASPGERLTPFTRAFYRAIALTGAGQADDAISELQAAAPSRAKYETSLDNTDKALLNRFTNPPLLGIEQLRQYFEATETTDPSSPA
jgi:DNA-binding transcriptional regulator GbsR (MarR family)/S1-C subfamily serine protease